LTALTVKKQSSSDGKSTPTIPIVVTFSIAVTFLNFPIFRRFWQILPAEYADAMFTPKWFIAAWDSGGIEFRS